MRYLIRFSYDGTNFCGYQKQPNDKRTVEGCLEKALYEINNHKDTPIYSSGRTDAGVHAINQVAHFDLDIKITLFKLKCALNSLLPEDIHVSHTEIVDDDFHSRYHVKKKIYEYYLNTGEYIPTERNYVYQYGKELDIDKMIQGSKYLIGKHDFKNYVSLAAKKENYEREIFSIKITKRKNIIKFTFSGSGFMKYQVRNMVGTLIKVGNGKLEPIDIKRILDDSKNVTKVFTAGACGLYLKDVKY